MAAAIVLLTLNFGAAQTNFNKNQRDRVAQMMTQIANNVRKHYYDPAYHGVDMEARFTLATETIQKANNPSEAFGAIAEALDALNDSHTFFDPPSRSTRRDFGFVLKMIGDGCYITDVRPRTDASEKLAPGDRVLTWEGYAPTRETMWKMNYSFKTLLAATNFHFKTVRPDGSERTVQVAAKVTQQKRVLDINSDDYWQLIREDENAEHLSRQRNAEFGDSLVVWKMPEFDLTDEEADKELKIVRKHQALVLDLRGNPGGLVKTLQFIIGGLFDHDITIATRKGRRSDLKPMVAKKHGTAFQGKIVVLIDSKSASASELFARVMQLEHRATVIGDASSGSVMEARYYSMDEGVDTKIFYGVSVTDADLIMADGKSLEHVGVTPDRLMLPTAADMAEGKDPVLAEAIKMMGGQVDAVAAGKMFPYEWLPN
jgi:C-terminal processing protease CtpA/Prc